MRFPYHRVMFTDPGFVVAKLVEPAQHLKVPFMAVLQGPFRRMRRHCEIAELHGRTLPCCPLALSGPRGASGERIGTPLQAIGQAYFFKRQFDEAGKAAPVHSRPSRPLCYAQIGGWSKRARSSQSSRHSRRQPVGAARVAPHREPRCERVSGLPPLGEHVVTGENAKEWRINWMRSSAEGRLSMIEALARKPR